MIADLKPYPAMKDSGVPWLGKVPEHWDVRRMKLLLREVDSRSSSGDEQLLRVSQYTGVTQRKVIDGSDEPNTRASSLVGYKRVAVNDLVVNIMLAWNGSMGVSRYDGIASPAYCVYRFRSGVRPWYYHELLRLPVYKGRIKTSSTGVVESRLRLYSDDLGRIEAILPPCEEQDAIVRFLDYADRRIQRYILAKQKLIKLLEEQKQAIIHRAVTRGLDHNIRCRPSGEEWLGDVPGHWESWKIGHFSRVGNGSTPSRGNSAYWSSGHYPWLNSSYANQENVTQADQFVTDTALRECHLPIVPPASVLVAITGQGKTRGKATVLRIEATINQHMAFITPNTKVASADYVRLALQGSYAQLRSISDDSGSTKGALTCADLKHFRLMLPPLPEQSLILTAVERETRTCSVAIDRAHREIALLREYRTRLIADVVTGKLDVRAAAVKLPEEADEPDPLDGVEALAEGDEETDDADLDAVPEEAEA